MKLEYFQRNFEKSSNIKFNQNPSIGSRTVLYRRRDKQTGRHDEANSHFPKFCEDA